MGSEYNGWDAEEIFKKYLHDYMVKRNMHKTAEIFAREANADDSPVVSAINAPQGFLAEWWSIFHDVYFNLQPTNEVATEKASEKGKQVTGTAMQNLYSEASKSGFDEQGSVECLAASNLSNRSPQPFQRTCERVNRKLFAGQHDMHMETHSSNCQNSPMLRASCPSNPQRNPRKQAQQRQKRKHVESAGSTPLGLSVHAESKTIGAENTLDAAPLNGWPVISASQVPPHLGHQVLNSYLQSAKNQPPIEKVVPQSPQELFAQFLAGARELSPFAAASDLDVLLRKGLVETSAELIGKVSELHSSEVLLTLCQTYCMGIAIPNLVGGQESLLLPKVEENVLYDRNEEERVLDETIGMFLTQYDGYADCVDASSVSHQQSPFEKHGQTGLDISVAEVGSLDASKGKVLSCNFSPDGKLLACAGHDKKAFVWNMDTLSYTSTLERHAHLITDVRFHPYSKAFATSSFDRTVQIWDAAGPCKSLFSLHGHTDHVMSLDFHPRKMDLLCSCDSNDEIRLWNINEYTCVRVSKGATRQVRFEPRSGMLLATAAGNGVNIFDVETGDFQFDLKGHESEVRSLSWDVTGQYIASVSEESVRLWSVLSGGRCVYELRSRGACFQSCTFHPGHSLLLVIGSYQFLGLWNPTQSSTVDTIPAHKGLIASLASSPLTGLIASASHDQCVKLWK